MTHQALTVNFHGTDLFVVDYNGQPYTPMKQIVEGMGLAWQTQHRKLNANKERWGITKMVIPSAGDLQETICMPLRKLAGWLATISPNKVKPELKDKIIQYQNECDDVLWDHWQQKHQPTLKQKPEPKTKKALPGCLTLEMQDEIKALITERVENELPKEKWRSGAIKMWGSIKTKFGLTKEQTYKELPADQFAACISLLARLPLEGEVIPAKKPALLPYQSLENIDPPYLSITKERVQRLKDWARSQKMEDMVTDLEAIERGLVSSWTHADESLMRLKTAVQLLERWRNQ